MSELKLGKLPDRTPVKITITVSPDINKALHAYAEFYRERYGEAEPVPELIPFMLATFIDADTGFKKARRKLFANGETGIADPPSSSMRRSRRPAVAPSDDSSSTST